MKRFATYQIEGGTGPWLMYPDSTSRLITFESFYRLLRDLDIYEAASKADAHEYVERGDEQ